MNLTSSGFINYFIFGGLSVYSLTGGKKPRHCARAFITLKLIEGFRINTFLEQGRLEDDTLMGKRKDERPALHARFRMAVKHTLTPLKYMLKCKTYVKCL